MVVPAHQQSIVAAFTARAAAHPERPALRFKDRGLSYAELHSAVGRTASGLRELGVGRGSRVALMLANGPEFVACWLALAWLGATMVPLNVRLKGDVLAYQLGHAQPDVAVVGAELLETFESARPANADPRLVVVGGRGAPPAGWLGLAEVLAGAPVEAPPPVRARPDELALVMYTSGTTGRPKGVMIGRQAQLKHGLNYTGLLGIQPGETAYVYLPLFHVTAMGSTLGCLLGGGTVALDDGFTPFGFWDRCRRHGAVVFTFVGSVLSMLHQRPPRADDADNPVRRAMGAATPVHVWRDFERRFGLEIVETYGQTELAALWLMPPDGGEGESARGGEGESARGGEGEATTAPRRRSSQAFASKVGTVGKPPEARFEVRIVGPDGLGLPTGERGEIVLRPADPLDMMLGYFRDPEATALALRSDGWYYTGDLGVTDEEGYVAYAGRLKDCIRRRGEMIAAFEIERVVTAHPGVLEAAAVGVPSELGEEDVKLCVVARPAELTARQVWEYCRATLPSFMVPRWVQLRESLPRTATERVRKPELVAEGVAACWTAGA